jgi:hypothetical protein
MIEEGPEARTAPAFNKAVFDRLAFDGVAAHLAAGAIGGGVQAGFPDLLALSVADEKKPDFKATAHRGWEILARNGAELVKDGKTLAGQAANEAELVDLLTNFQANRLPMYRDLGVV